MRLQEFYMTMIEKSLVTHGNAERLFKTQLGTKVIIYLCRRYKISQRRQKAVEVGGRQKKGERKGNILWIAEL